MTIVQTDIICNRTCNRCRRPAIIRCKPELFVTETPVSTGDSWPLCRALHNGQNQSVRELKNQIAERLVVAKKTASANQKLHSPREYAKNLTGYDA